MTKNKVGSCSKCGNEVFNTKNPYNTNYWALNNKYSGKTNFYCDNCWENGIQEQYFQPPYGTVETECDHCKETWVKGINAGDYEATKNHHINHEHNQTRFTGSEPCDLCKINTERERGRERRNWQTISIQLQSSH